MKNTEPRLKPGSGSRFAGGLLAVFLIALALCATIGVWGSLRLLRYKGETVGTDGSIGYFGYRVYRGGPVYARADEPPYTPSVYGPLLYLSLAAVGRIARPASFHSFVVDGRVFMFVLFLLIAVVAYRWARRWGLGPVFALAAPLLVFADRTFSPFDVGPRPDIAAVLFALLGFSALSQSDEPDAGRVAGAGFLMGLAFLFKQTFLAAPAAAFFWLLWKRRYRLAAVLAAAGLAPVIVTIGWLELRGEPVLYSLLLLRHAIYDVPGESRLVASLVIACPTVILQVALALVGLAALRRRYPDAARLAVLYLAFAAAIALATMGQVGGTRHYLMETMTVCSVLAPFGLDRWIKRLRVAAFEMRLGAALIFVGLPGLCALTFTSNLTAPLPSWGGLCSAVAGHRVLSSYPYLAAQARDPEMLDTWLMGLLERTGQWSPAPVLRQIKQRQFDYVVLGTEPGSRVRPIPRTAYRGAPFLSPRILEEVERDYRMAGLCVEGNAVVFVPKQEPRGTELARPLAAACGWQLLPEYHRDERPQLLPHSVMQTKSAGGKPSRGVPSPW